MFHQTLKSVLLLCVLEAVGAAELLKAEHLREKQRCEEMESRMQKVQEEAKKLYSDKERLKQVDRLWIISFGSTFLTLEMQRLLTYAVCPVGGAEGGGGAHAGTQ